MSRKEPAGRREAARRRPPGSERRRSPKPGPLRGPCPCFCPLEEGGRQRARGAAPRAWVPHSDPGSPGLAHGHRDPFLGAFAMPGGFPCDASQALGVFGAGSTRRLLTPSRVTLTLHLVSLDLGERAHCLPGPARRDKRETTRSRRQGPARWKAEWAGGGRLLDQDRGRGVICSDFLS